MAITNLIVHDGPAYDAHGQLVRVRIVAYMVDGIGPLGFSGLATELTNEEVRRRIKADAEGIRSLVQGLE